MDEYNLNAELLGGGEVEQTLDRAVSPRLGVGGGKGGAWRLFPSVQNLRDRKKVPTGSNELRKCVSGIPGVPP